MAVTLTPESIDAWTLCQLEQHVEQLLVCRNVRGMAQLQLALQPGYLKRAAALLYQPGQRLLLTTGFPVGDTFESDGPLGAILIAQMLQRCKVQFDWVCGPPLAEVLPLVLQTLSLQLQQAPSCSQDGSQNAHAGNLGRVLRLPLGEVEPAELIPLLSGCYAAALSIERPGRASDGRYYNMRREDISQRIADVDTLWQQLGCPTVAVGDGGNEIGMGNIYHQVQRLDIEPAATGCDELVLADVSNWAAYGLAFYWSLWSDQDLFRLLNPEFVLQLLLQYGCVDGVTRRPELSEDGFALNEGLALCQQIYQCYQHAVRLQHADE
jgi:hypothetical protein